MKTYDDMKAEMEEIQQQMVKAKENESGDAQKAVKRLYKEVGFRAGLLKDLLAEGREKLIKNNLLKFSNIPNYST